MSATVADDRLADLGGELGELDLVQPAQVGGSLEVRQDGHGRRTPAVGWQRSAASRKPVPVIGRQFRRSCTGRVPGGRASFATPIAAVERPVRPRSAVLGGRTSRVSRAPPARATSCWTRSSASREERSQRAWRATPRSYRASAASSGWPPASSSATVRWSSARASSKRRASSIGAGGRLGRSSSPAPRRRSHRLPAGRAAARPAYPGRSRRPRRPRRRRRRRASVAAHARGRRRGRPRSPAARRGRRRRRRRVPAGASAGSRTIAPSARPAHDGVAALEGRLRARATAERAPPAASSAAPRPRGDRRARDASARRVGRARRASSRDVRSPAERAPSTARVARSSSRPTRSRAAASWAAGLSRSSARRSAASSRAAGADAPRRRAVEPRPAPPQRRRASRRGRARRSRRRRTASAARTSAAKSASVTSTSWPTPADDRHRVGDDRPDDPLVVERPEVLERAAAAGEDRHAPGASSGRPAGRTRARRSARAAGTRRRCSPARPSPWTWAATRTTRTSGQRRAEDVADVLPDGAGRAR